MGSLGGLCGGGCPARRHTTAYPLKIAANRPFSPSIAHLQAKPKALKASVTISRSEIVKSRSIPRQKLDEWMHNSLADILKNLRNSPLLVHVYPGNGGSEVELRTQSAVAEADWLSARTRWEKEESRLPEGVIFVEELASEDEGDGVDRVWGIVVQGRVTECGSACFLLKTSRCDSGLGFFCTYFYLTRVTSFEEKVKTQLKKCWLVQ